MEVADVALHQAIGGAGRVRQGQANKSDVVAATLRAIGRIRPTPLARNDSRTEL